MTLQIPTEQLQQSVLDFLQRELGDAWNDLPEQQRELITRVAINYGKENVKLLVSELFQGIDKKETKTNIEQIKAQLQALGVVLQGQVLIALNKAISNALRNILALYATGNSEVGDSTK